MRQQCLHRVAYTLLGKTLCLTTVSEASRQYDLSPSEVEGWIDNATAGIENALKAKPDNVREQYERQIKDLQDG